MPSVLSCLLHVGHAARDQLPDEVRERLLVLLRDVDGPLVHLGEHGRVDVDLLLGEHRRHRRRRHRRVTRDLLELLLYYGNHVSSWLGNLEIPLFSAFRCTEMCHGLMAK